ncbi:54S ribosomal protein L2 mitochondrial [Rhizina undulata]
MLLPRIFSSLGLAAATACKCAPTLFTSTIVPVQKFAQRPSPIVNSVRYATHKASRPANKAKDGPGKRLGAKKTAGERVRIGMIIYRQRGTLWYPGENVGMGRDHTIFAMAPGFVRYYKDPTQPKRKFIGVALKEEHVLPKPLNAATRRRFGMVEVPLNLPEKKVEPGTPLEAADTTIRDGFYMYRPANWRIGKTMDAVDVKNNNTWARWRKRTRRHKNYKLKRGIGGGR